MANKINIQWSSEELDMKSAVKRLRRKLPMLLIVRKEEVTSVYGEDDGYSFYKNDIFWITHVLKLERILAKNIYGKLVSIPNNYPVRFHLIDENEEYSQPEPVSFLMERLETGDLFIPENINQFRLGKLEYISTYSERFYIGNNMYEEGNIQKDVIVIPFHTNITLSQAVALERGTEQDFQKFLHDLKNKSDAFSNQHNAEIYAEIEIFDDLPGNLEDDYVDYDYVKPKNYYTWGESKTTKDYEIDHSLTDSPLYEVNHPPPPIPARRQALTAMEQKPTKTRLPASPPGHLKDTKRPVRPVTIAVDNGKEWSAYICDDVQEEDLAPAILPRNPYPVTPNNADIYKPRVKPDLLNIFTSKTRDTLEFISKKIVKVNPLPRKRGKERELPTENRQIVRTEHNKRRVSQIKTRSLPRLPSGNQNADEYHDDFYDTIESVDRNMTLQRSESDGGSSIDELYNRKEQSRMDLTPRYKIPPRPVPVLQPVQEQKDQFTELDDNKGPYGSLNDVPRDIATLTVGQVGRVLELMNLEKHKGNFRNNDIDGAMLTSLSDTILDEDFAFSKYEVLKLKKFISTGWIPKT